MDLIYETLIEGRTYIASIDGVGGIGKTALTYNFCEKRVIAEGQFDYLVWVTAKDMVFDAELGKTVEVKNEFKDNSLNALVNETLNTVDCREYLDEDFEVKLDFFVDLVSTEKIFFVLDNLESIHDPKFFDFIKRFNKFSRGNDYLKVLTTSRRRTRIADFPIEISGLNTADALKMLESLARNHPTPIKSILKASDFQRETIINRIGGIPLGIEFFVGQAARKKNFGQIYEELEGYPDIEEAKTESEKQSILSEIIQFSFRDMYESLEKNHHVVFENIAASKLRKTRGGEDIKFEDLMVLSNLSDIGLTEALETLIENKLIHRTPENRYSLNQMSMNFAQRYYPDFGEVLNEYERYKKSIRDNKVDHIDVHIEKARACRDKSKYEDALNILQNALSHESDYRLYLELGKTQVSMHRDAQAKDSFVRATRLSPKQEDPWFELINLDVKDKHLDLALADAESALEHTNSAVLIAKQAASIYVDMEDYVGLRKFVKKQVELYNKSKSRVSDAVELLDLWCNVEHELIISDQGNRYFDAVNLYVKTTPDYDDKHQILESALIIAKRFQVIDKIGDLQTKLKRTGRDIQHQIPSLQKRMNKANFDGQLEESSKFASTILTHANPKVHLQEMKNALRVWLQNLSTNNEYEEIIHQYKRYQNVGALDEGCEKAFRRAEKEVMQQQKNKIIKQISSNLLNAEASLREFIMTCFYNSEENLFSFLRPLLRQKRENVQSDGQYDWINSWQINRKKSLSEMPILEFSVLPQIKQILIWMIARNSSVSMLSDKSIRTLCQEIINNLKHYTISHRNNTFHARVVHFELEKLYEYEVDSNRLSRTSAEIHNLSLKKTK